MKLWLNLRLICLILALGSATYADTAVPVKLSVHDAIQIAVESNVTLKQSEYATLDSAANYRIAKTLTTYGLTAETDVTHSLGVTTVDGTAGVTASYSGLYGTAASMTVNPFGLGNERGAVGLSVSQPLLSGSGLFAPKYNQVMNAKSALTIQEKTATYSQQSTVFNVVSAYYQAVLARSQVGIQNSAVQAAEDSAKFLRRKVDAGFEAGIGLAQADVAVMQAKESLTSAQQNAQTALDSLMLTMGIGVGSSPELVDDVPDYDPPLPGLSEAIRTALTNRFEIVQYNEQVLEQRRALAMANDQLRSGLGVTASWTSTQANSGFVGNSLVDLASTFVGVKLTVPLDQRSLRESRDISARALDLVQKERGATDEQLADNVRLAFHSVEAARASVANLSENQKVVNLQVFQAQRRLEEGLGTTFDLVTAHNDQATFKVQLQTARVNLYLAHLQLNLAMGERVNAVGAK